VTDIERTWERDGLRVTIRRTALVASVLVWTPHGSKWAGVPIRTLGQLTTRADESLVSLWMRVKMLSPEYGRRVIALRAVMPQMIASALDDRPDCLRPPRCRRKA
jgi:hypothetical protein